MGKSDYGMIWEKACLGCAWKVIDVLEGALTISLPLLLVVACYLIDVVCLGDGIKFGRERTAAGADNRPLMIEKSQYNSWHRRMKLYIRGKEHGKDLLDLVLNGPFKYRTAEVPDTSTTPASTRPRTYDDLTNKEKIHEECDIKEINIVLKGLPPYIYNLMNHHTDAKEIVDRVKLLIEGFNVSKSKEEVSPKS
nr:hypothetical protein [Tanacetum cinerariifolium]